MHKQNTENYGNELKLCLSGNGVLKDSLNEGANGWSYEFRRCKLHENKRKLYFINN